MPHVLRVGRVVVEEDGNAPGDHGIEGRSARGSIPPGLQAEGGVQKGLHDRLRIVAAFQNRAVDERAIARFRALIEQIIPDALRDVGSRRPREREERCPPGRPHSSHPGLQLGRARVERGQIRDSPLMLHPRLLLHNQSRHVGQVRQLEEPGSPLSVRLVAEQVEIPRRAPQNHEVILAAVALPLLLRVILDPLDQSLAVRILLNGAVVEIPQSVHSHVVGEVEGVSSRRVGRQARVFLHARVEDDLQHVRIRLVPPRAQPSRLASRWRQPRCCRARCRHRVLRVAVGRRAPEANAAAEAA
ncbi:hypothetical protein Mapa_003487 [Marchantia paleacea]|nr:hypothetical protein Mapa_003487 [Marchantia paleacea]